LLFVLGDIDPVSQRALVVILAAVLASTPLLAQAHAIHPWMAAAALSPLLALALAVALGFLSRSAIKGMVHCGLIILWVLLFWLASNLVTSDLIIWTPLILYAIHVLVLIALVVIQARARISTA
jgi:hypothetical protein